MDDGRGTKSLISGNSLRRVIYMRKCYLVCYDIRNPKRLRDVHKLVKGYGEAWQYSVFFCILKDIDRVRLETELKEIMNLKEDRAFIVYLGQNESDVRGLICVLGQPLPRKKEGIVIV